MENPRTDPVSDRVKSSPRSCLWILFGIALVLILLGAFFIYSIQDHSLDLTVSKSGPTVIFSFKECGVNGVLRVTVFDPETKHILWSLEPNYYTAPSLPYGMMALRPDRQLIPKAGRPVPAIPVGRELAVEVVYQGDWPVPSTDSATVAFVLDSSGGVRCRRGEHFRYDLTELEDAYR